MALITRLNGTNAHAADQRHETRLQMQGLIRDPAYAAELFSIRANILSGFAASQAGRRADRVGRIAYGTAAANHQLAVDLFKEARNGMVRILSYDSSAPYDHAIAKAVRQLTRISGKEKVKAATADRKFWEARMMASK